MAQELQFYGNPETQSGLTVTISLYNTEGVEVSTGILAPEVGVLAIYIADMPSVVADDYVVRFFEAGNFLAQGHIYWDGTKEICHDTLIKETHQLLGFDSENPLVTNGDTITSGDIIIDVDGDCDSTVTLTRQ